MLNRSKRFALALVALIIFAGSFNMPAQAATSYRSFSFSATWVDAPTGQKPQSKLWFNSSQWWGSLFNVATGNYEIYRLDGSTQQWSSTGTIIDSRNGSSADTLWDGNHLYVVSAGLTATDTAQNAKIMRYSFDETSRTYSLDAGFPISLATAGGMETIVIAKDTAGTVWAAYAKGGKVYAAHSTTDESVWTAPYPINTTGSNNLTSDDIASIVAFGGSVGILWSNQTDHKIYFAEHVNGTADTVWNSASAISGSYMADDHLSLKADSAGKVYAITKTSRADVSGASTEPVIVLAVRDTSGNWTNHTVAQNSEGSVTRGIVALDETTDSLYAIYTSSESGGAIVYKKSSLSNIAFPVSTPGTPLIQSDVDLNLNNATTSKQLVTPESGLLVLAGDKITKYYVHNFLGSATTPPASPTPSATPTTSTLSFAPTADAKVLSGSPSTNYGASSTLEVDASPSSRTLLKFNVAGIGTGTVESVKLRLYTVNASPHGGNVHRVSNTAWTENSVTWLNAPTADSGAIASIPAVSAGKWIEVTLPGLIAADGTYSISLEGINTNGADYSSKEASSNRPALIVNVSNVVASPTVSPAPTPTPAPTQTPTPTPTPTPTASPVPASTAILQFKPAADAKLLSGSPTRNYGTSSTLEVDASPSSRSLMRFNVTGIGSGTVTGVKLRLYTVNSSPHGGNIHRILDNTWSENTVTWSNAPSVGSAALTSLPVVTAGKWIEVEIPGLLSQDGTYSFSLEGVNTNGADYSSRESSSNSPVLLVTVSS